VRHLLSISDLTPEEARFLIAEAVRLKRELAVDPARQRASLRHQNLAMIFEKPSLRTRVSFDIGITQLGGHPLYLSPQEIGLGTREPVADVARVLSRMCQGIMARVFAHQTVCDLARHATVPVINGLSDREHPCQALADLLTLHEHKGLEGRKLAYIGDGNNVCHSLLLLCARLGVQCAVAAPQGYQPLPEVVADARRVGKVEVTTDPGEAVSGADAVYTDVWTSMGQEAENERRLQVFPPYQVNRELMRRAKADAIVLHDLPAHRGEEITDEVMESAQSVIFDQAENRLHAQKAVMVWLMGAGASTKD